MKSKITITIILILIQAILHVPIASSDCIPTLKYEVHSTLRENRQLAYIEVNDDGTETINLFLGITSFYPGENITLVVPLRTLPTYINLENKTDYDFKKENNFRKLDEFYEKQKEGLDLEKYRNSLAPPPGIAYHFWSGESRTDDIKGFQYFEEEGVGVEVHSFESAKSLEDFYKSLNIKSDKSVEKMIEKYGKHYIVVINATSKPPIPEDKFEILTKYAPNSINKFFDYVKKHPSLEVKGYNSVQDLMWGEENGELGEICNEIFLEIEKNTEMNYTINNYIENLVASIYGYNEVDGFLLTLKVPLFENQAYFPLGTTSSWNAVSEIEIVFSCNTTKEIIFNNKEYIEVFYNNKHYYIWKYNDFQPDFDLEGKLEKASFRTKMKENEHKIKENLTPRSTAISLIFLITLVFTNLFISYFYYYKKALVTIQNTHNDENGHEHLFSYPSKTLLPSKIWEDKKLLFLLSIFLLLLFGFWALLTLGFFISEMLLSDEFNFRKQRNKLKNLSNLLGIRILTTTFIMLVGLILVLDLFTYLGLWNWMIVITGTIIINILIVILLNKLITKFEKKKSLKAKPEVT